MECLSVRMSGLSMATKRSYVEALLQEQANADNASKARTRTQLVRAKNKRDAAAANVRKN